MCVQTLSFNNSENFNSRDPSRTDFVKRSGLTSMRCWKINKGRKEDRKKGTEKEREREKERKRDGQLRESLVM